MGTGEMVQACGRLTWHHDILWEYRLSYLLLKVLFGSYDVYECVRVGNITVGMGTCIFDIYCSSRTTSQTSRVSDETDFYAGTKWYKVFRRNIDARKCAGMRWNASSPVPSRDNLT